MGVKRAGAHHERDRIAHEELVLLRGLELAGPTPGLMALRNGLAAKVGREVAPELGAGGLGVVDGGGQDSGWHVGTVGGIGLK
jgi:hypothetical protein